MGRGRRTGIARDKSKSFFPRMNANEHESKTETTAKSKDIEANDLPGIYFVLPEFRFIRVHSRSFVAKRVCFSLSALQLSLRTGTSPGHRRRHSRQRHQRPSDSP